MPITCFIIDDEPPAVKVLERYTGQYPQLKLLGSATDAIEGLQRVQESKPQLLFLDINMPKLSGISLLRSLPHPPEVIFTTAYPEYALEGFELEAVDYLLKPFSFERFLKAVNKCRRLLNADVGREEQPAHLLLSAGRKLFRIALEDILYLEAYGDYVKVYTSQGMYLPKTTLNALEEQLPEGRFVRVHRSFLIALNQIRYIEGNQLVIAKEKLPIGRSYKEKLLRLLED